MYSSCAIWPSWLACRAVGAGHERARNRATLAWGPTPLKARRRVTGRDEPY